MDANSTPNPVYTRGTKTVRVTTAKLRGGEVLLTADCPANPQFAANTGTKTGSVLRTVAKPVEAQMEAAHGFFGRQTRRYTVTFTDGTTAGGMAPAETWARVTELPGDASLEMAAATDAHEARRQAETVTGPELSPADRAAVDAHQEKAAAKTGACLHCNLPTKGGDYLPGHDASHASAVYAAILGGAPEAEALRVLSPALRAKVQARIARHTSS